MNYQKHYDTLINRAKNRLLEGYSERHHIIPRCMGGTNRKDNLVALTAEEHYVAHQLLVKMYPDNDKLIYAAKIMTISGSDNIRNNKLYDWLKVKFSSVNSSNMKKYYRNNPEARAKRSASAKEFLKNNPEKHPMKNPETRAKQSASLKEHYNNPEARAKRSAFMKNNPEKHPMKNPETIAKMTASMKEHYRKKKLANG